MNSIINRASLAAGLALTLAVAASAQPAPKERHRIAVNTTGGQCTYAIQDQADQDLFLIEPGGEVQFQPRGLAVIKVTVQPDPASGIEGGEGVQQMWVRNSRPSEFPVRTDLNRETMHEVVIECCTDTGRRRTCPDGRLIRATPEAEGIGRARDSTAEVGLAGPSASVPSHPVTEPRVVGPRMKVLE